MARFRINKNIFILLILYVVIVFILASCNNDGQSNGNSSDNNWDDTVKTGYIIPYDKWVYYVDSDQKIYKTNGEKTEKINDDLSSEIKIVDGWIYYAKLDCTNDNYGSEIFRIRTDGTDMQSLGIFVEDEICIYKDWIYFRNGDYEEEDYDDNLYKIRTDGTDKQSMKIEYADTIDVYDDWIYLGYDETNQIFKVKTDGSEKQIIKTGVSETLTMVDDSIYFFNISEKLCSMKIDDTNHQEIGEIYCDKDHIHITSDWIYYHTEDDYYSNDDVETYRVSLDGSDKEKINDNWSEDINIADEWIYYSNGDDNYKIYKSRTDGAEKKKINNDNSTNTTLIGEWLYYFNEDDKGRLYRIKTDGTERHIVSTQEDKASHDELTFEIIFPDPVFAYTVAALFNKSIADKTTYKELESYKGELFSNSMGYIPYYKIPEENRFEHYKEKWMHAPCFSYEGIGHLTGLTSFSAGKDDTTELPSEIGKLKNLKSLNLMKAYSLEKLPPEIGELEQLIDLNLCMSDIKYLPPEIGKLKNLRYLNLNNTPLKELPNEIGGLKSLLELDISHTDVEVLPESIYELKQLRVLDYSNTRVKGISPKICQLTELAGLGVAGCDIKELPEDFGDLIKLENLYLKKNDLKKLPYSLSNMKFLWLLNVYDNYNLRESYKKWIPDAYDASDYYVTQPKDKQTETLSFTLQKDFPVDDYRFLDDSCFLRVIDDPDLKGIDTYINERTQTFKTISQDNWSIDGRKLSIDRSCIPENEVNYTILIVGENKNGDLPKYATCRWNVIDELDDYEVL